MSQLQIIGLAIPPAWVHRNRLTMPPLTTLGGYGTNVLRGWPKPATRYFTTPE